MPNEARYGYLRLLSRMPFPLAFFAYFVVSAAALATLLHEFGAKDGWDFARVYSHIFLYPLIFGLFMVPCALRAMQLLWEMNATRRAIWWLLAVVAVVATLATLGQLFQPPAAFEYKKDALSKKVIHPSGKTALEHFQRPEPEPKSENAVNAERQRAIAKEHRKMFSERLGQDSLFVRDASLTKVTFFLSFVTQVVAMACVYLVLAWCILLYRRGDHQYFRARKVLIPSLLWMVILAYPWLVMRRAFEIYRGQIYDTGSVSEATVVGVLFLLGTFYLVAVSWKTIGKRFEPILATVTSIGLTGLVFKDNWVEATFPRDAHPSHYAMLLAVVVLALGPVLIPVPGRNPSGAK